MKKILIIDDSATIRAILRTHIESAGYQVVEASGPMVALDILKHDKSFNCFIIDYNMPEMNGADLIKQIKKIYKFTPCILLTSETDVDNLYLAKSYGAATILEKPISEFKLRNILKIIVGI